MTAVIGWRFAYVIRTTYKWWVEVCANGKQEVATGCFHRWSGHELTPLHRPTLPPPLSLSHTHLFESLFFPPFTSFSLPLVASSHFLPQRSLFFSRLLLLHSSVAIPSSCSCLDALIRFSLSSPLFVLLSLSLSEADPWHVTLDV